MAAESLRKTLLVVLGLSLVCSFLVSTAAILLLPRQEENRRLERFHHILVAASLDQPGTDTAAVYARRIEPVMIELASGTAVDTDRFDDTLNIETFDIATLANHSEWGEDVPRHADPAKIKRRPRYMLVHLVKGEDGIEKLILPVYGQGLWSTLYGFLALERDLRSIAGITFYEHAETPGLGGEVDNPAWKEQWRGKLAFDADGQVAIRLAKGSVDPESTIAMYRVDGLAGATITSRGVSRLVRYWLGANGYGPFLDQLRAGTLRFR